MEKVIPRIIICCPFDLYWIAEVEVQLTNFRKYGYSQHTSYLVFEQGENLYKDYWDKLELKFPEASFYFYQGDRGTRNLIAVYQPVSRPFCLKKHWERFPQLQQETILYMDSDVLFSRELDFSAYMTDDICYASQTPYIGVQYFNNKAKDVYLHKQQDYSQIDVIERLGAAVGINKQTIVDNDQHVGGCQYILKNIDSLFWATLMEDCIKLRMTALQLNAEFFPSEDLGLQSWAIGDMCGLLWGLWKRGKELRTPDALSFSWASSPIEEYDKCVFFHNAGIYAKVHTIDGVDHKMFHKGDLAFRQSKITFFDIEEYKNISPYYCSCKYVEAIREVKDPVAITDKLVY